MVTCHVINLQFIWKLGNRRFHLWVPEFQITCKWIALKTGHQVSSLIIDHQSDILFSVEMKLLNTFPLLQIRVSFCYHVMQGIYPFAIYFDVIFQSQAMYLMRKALMIRVQPLKWVLLNPLVVTARVTVMMTRPLISNTSANWPRRWEIKVSSWWGWEESGHWPGVGVTKALFVNFSISGNFDLSKV